MTRELKFGRVAAQSGQAKSLVVFLHGYGADGADLLGLADPLAAHLPYTAFAAPDAPAPCAGNPFGRQWFPIPRFDGSSEVEAAVEMNRAAEDLNAFLDQRLAEEGLTPAALALVGFSQGAMMSLHVAPRRAQAIAGVVAISGRLLRPQVLAQEALVKPPVVLIHGDRDDVVPFQEMQTAGNALVAAGFETFGHVMHGTGHGIAPDGLGVAMQFLKERLPG
ncbi:alpha/beta hydrolase [Tabrizicola oligotrophica]|uniref:Prolyl oligopeptidase family serine peptidase n=1 Tax=Tabrizicola oligotrophica TaxID=2710650 RepID=A0A6M0QNR2_9RHOB|nr:alpha/beta fold hydrolase [Tabrizicola oligotrophica]NEY89118.1 prolyl oligopeptidase family serine peptidase [Tabrizicola oligotrophica]